MRTKIRIIQSAGIPCINFFCDHVRDFTELPREFRCFDLSWVPEQKALQLYKDESVPYLHLPMPMWVPLSLRQIKNESNKHIIFIGSRDIQRIRFFETLLSLAPEISLQVYGRGWDNENIGKGPISPKTPLIDRLQTNIYFYKRTRYITRLSKIQTREAKQTYRIFVAVLHLPLAVLHSIYSTYH